MATDAVRVKSTRYIFIVVAAYLGISIAIMFSGSVRLSSDAAFYMGLADSILAGDGFTFNGQAVTHIPPGTPLLLAVVRWISPSVIWLNAVLTGIILLCIFLFWRLIRSCTDRPEVVAIGLALFGANPFLLRYGIRPLSDVPALAAILAGMIAVHRWSLCTTDRRRLAWLGAILGCFALAALFRWAGLIAFAATAFSLLFAENQRLGRRLWRFAQITFLLLLLLAGGALYLSWVGSSGPGEILKLYGVSGGLLTHIGSSAQSNIVELLNGLGYILFGQPVRLYGGLAVVAILAAAAVGARRGLPRWLIVWPVFYCLLVLPTVLLRPRYLLPVLPVLVIILAWSFGDCREKVRNKVGPRLLALLGALFTPAIIVWHIPKNVAQVAKIHRQQVGGVSVLSENDLPCVQLGQMIRQGDYPSDATIVVAEQQSAILCYTSGRRVLVLPMGRAVNERTTRLALEQIASTYPEPLLIVHQADSPRSRYLDRPQVKRIILSRERKGRFVVSQTSAGAKREGASNSNHTSP